MMLKGGGTVPPSSKYEIHNLLLANFHSMSAFSCEIVVKILDSHFHQYVWAFTHEKEYFLGTKKSC